MIGDLLALGLATGCIVAAGHGVLRVVGVRPRLLDLPCSLALAYVAGAAAVGVVGSALLVAGLSLSRWQLVVLCAGLLALGIVRPRRDGLGVDSTQARAGGGGWLRLFPVAAAAALAVLAVDLAVQPLWTDDAWSIWAVKAVSIVELGGLDPAFIGSASVVSGDYPLVVPVLELVAMRFCGWPNELVPLQLGLVFLAFPAALVALLRARVRPLLLATVVLAVAVAPSLQVQAASAVADVTLGVFFALAGAAGWRWVETGEQALLLLATVFAAAAIGSKAEGLVFVALLFGALVVASRSRAALVAGAAALLTLLPWELWTRHHGIGNPVADAGGATVGPLDRVPRAAFDVGRELADPTSWLALVALGCAAVALGFRWDRRAVAFTAAVVLGCLATVVVAYWLTPLDFEYHVATSVRRVITAPVLFLAAMTPLLLERVGVHRERPLGHPRD